MHLLKYLICCCLLLSLAACDKENSLTPSSEDLFPAKRESALDKALRDLFGPYNTVIEYRYVENLLPIDWYNIKPAKEEKILPAMDFMKEMWVDALVTGSSEEFVQKHFPRMLVLVGSPAMQMDGSTEILGEAEGGTIVRFTRINDFTPKDKAWSSKQLNTAFHEYGHILHQTFNMPDEFRQITPERYTMNGWLVISQVQAITMGMVTPYGTSSVSEDFAELFSNYMILDDDTWDFIINIQEVEEPERPEADKDGVISDEKWAQWEEEMEKYQMTLELTNEMNQGRELLQKKFTILKKFLLENGLDMTKVRAYVQDKLKDFK